MGGIKNNSPKLNTGVAKKTPIHQPVITGNMFRLRLMSTGEAYDGISSNAKNFDEFDDSMNSVAWKAGHRGCTATVAVAISAKKRQIHRTPKSSSPSTPTLSIKFGASNTQEIRNAAANQLSMVVLRSNFIKPMMSR